MLVWKTNFDQLDFSEVLHSHKKKQEETTPSEPTVLDIQPRVARKPTKPKSPRGVGRFTCTISGIEFLQIFVNIISGEGGGGVNSSDSLLLYCYW